MKETTERMDGACLHEISPFYVYISDLSAVRRIKVDLCHPLIARHEAVDYATLFTT